MVKRWHWFCLIFFPLSADGECSLWVKADHVIESTELFHDLSMSTWTRIDLVQAIATTREQQEMILRHLVKNLMSLSASLEKISSYDRHFYKKLMQSMRFSFLNAFPLNENDSCKNVSLF